MRSYFGAFVVAVALSPTAQAVDCSPAAVARQPVALPSTSAPALAVELDARNAQLGMPSGVLSSIATPEQSLDAVLQRLRIEGCRNISAALPAAPAPAATAVNDPAAYQPQTAFDNTPWRFDMSQNGKRMTAEEFDAWMKARGVRVVQARKAPDVQIDAAKDPEVK